jgi:hypothetical protein
MGQYTMHRSHHTSMYFNKMCQFLLNNSETLLQNINRNGRELALPFSMTSSDSKNFLTFIITYLKMKEIVMAYFKVPSQHFPEGIKKQ